MISLTSYESTVNKIREYAKKNGISEKEINSIFTKCFDQLEKERLGFFSVAFFVGKMLLLLLLMLTLCSIILYNHPKTHNLVLRNLQHYIYPGLTIFRTFAVPIITKYPDLTNLYDEWCLIENPYFYVSDMDCWPCSSIISVPDLTGHNITQNFNIGIPFTKVGSNNKIYFHNLRNLYIQEKSIFNADAKNIVSNNLSYSTLDDVIGSKINIFPSLNEDVYVIWRITRLHSGRLLRKLFSKPIDIPNWWGQSTEKFVLIDEPKAPPYSLPNPECSNVIIQCSSGARLIRLEPSPECIQNCRILTVLLTAGHSFWYNWWYWRPKSFPVANQTEISINYLTSFC